MDAADSAYGAASRSDPVADHPHGARAGWHGKYGIAYLPAVLAQREIHHSLLDRPNRRSADAESLFLINTTSQWNAPLHTRLPGPKNEAISIDVTFRSPGAERIETLIGDASMPARFQLVGDQLFLQLEGIHDQSAGVLVLKRVLASFESTDFNMDGFVDALDLQLWDDVSIEEEPDPTSTEQTDVNNDGEIEEGDLLLIVNSILSR